jgi:hypothetical protein
VAFELFTGQVADAEAMRAHSAELLSSGR